MEKNNSAIRWEEGASTDLGKGDPRSAPCKCQSPATRRERKAQKEELERRGRTQFINRGRGRESLSKTECRLSTKSDIGNDRSFPLDHIKNEH